MSIPKNIFQTFKTSKLPLITRYYISRLKKQNPGWNYRFYNDDQILDFIEKEFPSQYLKAYQSLTIGAAKADFFRYAVLYQYGGVYIDIDGYTKVPFDDFILEDDQAVISRERLPQFYCQWALIFNRRHPFLKKTLEEVLYNIQNHLYPNDVHKTTGPAAYTNAINKVLKEMPSVLYRMLGVDYDKKIMPKYKLAKISLYGKRSEHWKKKQSTQQIIKPLNGNGS